MTCAARTLGFDIFTSNNKIYFVLWKYDSLAYIFMNRNAGVDITMIDASVRIWWTNIILIWLIYMKLLLMYASESKPRLNIVFVESFIKIHFSP